MRNLWLAIVRYFPFSSPPFVSGRVHVQCEMYILRDSIAVSVFYPMHAIFDDVCMYVCMHALMLAKERGRSCMGKTVMTCTSKNPILLGRSACFSKSCLALWRERLACSSAPACYITTS